MTNIGRAFAVITIGLAALFTTLSPGATAAPPTSHPHMASVCATGYRGQPAYDRACLTTGTPRNAAHLWDHVPTGTKGHEHDRADTQRGICKYGHRHGGVAAWVRDTVGDLTYDRYRNNTAVDRWTAQDAVLTCAQLGYRH